MFAEVPLIPEQASEMASRVDHLFLFLLVVTGTMGMLVTVLLIGFSLRYRWRPEHKEITRAEPAQWLEWFWTLAPMGVFLVMFVWGASVYTSAFIPPEDAEEVFVVGKQWMWKIQHPGGQREINTLHMPVNRAVKLTMTSEDVIHSFYVPAFRHKLDVIPGRYVHTWFSPNKVGRYHLFCAEYCGTGHSKMVGEVVVMEEEDYRAWLGGGPDGSLAVQGRQLFLKLQCIDCHSADSQARAPVLEGLYGKRVSLRGGESVLADDTYLRESILYPERKVVQGWDPIMPTFKGQVDEEDLIKLIAFLRNLGPGETPKRNEKSTPPLGAPTRPPGEKEHSSDKKSAPEDKKSDAQDSAKKEKGKQ